MLLSLGIGAFVVLLSIALRVAAAFGLTLPLLYGLLAPTLFHEWFYAHYDLANGIGYALLALTALSWILALIRRIRQIRAGRAEEQLSDEFLLRRIRESNEVDKNGYRVVNLDGLYRS